MRRRVAVLISGRGSNMLALLDATASAEYPAEIALVIADQPGAGGLALAGGRGVAALCIEHRDFGRDRTAHEAAMIAALEQHGIEIVCLAGYMRVFTPRFVAHFAGRLLNIHPSLLPAFPGLHTHARALAAGVKVHGCTVHLVTDKLDAGPILAQAAVPVLPDDTEATLAERVLRQEHRLYPSSLAAFAAHRAGQPADEAMALMNPLPLPGGTA